VGEGADMSIDGYTIEELAQHTGYAHGTIYNLTCAGALTPPIKGLPGNIPGRGTYLPRVLDELRRYRELKLEGRKRTDIIDTMRSERLKNVHLLEGRGEVPMASD
jgi:hypothetical protein